MAKLVEGVNDLATVNPVLVKQWASKNVLKPTEVTKGSNKKVWWECRLGHEWEAAINNRSNGSGCPVCNRQYVKHGVNDLATVNPELAKQWSDRNVLKPTEVTKGSDKKVWWECNLGHEWEAVIYDRYKGSGCPVCSGQKVEQDVNDLATVNPELAKQWSDRNVLKPTEVTKGSHKKVWWECNLGHEWEAVINSRSNGNGCPVCSGRQVEQYVNDLATVNPELAEQWSDRNVLNPTEVTKGSDKKVWWECDLGHEWEATISNRSNGNGCPVCSGNRVEQGVNDLATVNPELAEQWSDRNVLNPTEVTKGSNKKVWWECGLGHEWEAVISKRSAGSGCPRCASSSASKMETNMADFIDSLGFDTVRNSRDIISPLELDVFIPGLGIAVEFNGLYWHSDAKKMADYHQMKMRMCGAKNIDLIQVWEDDWIHKNDAVTGILADRIIDNVGVEDVNISTISVDDVLAFENGFRFGMSGCGFDGDMFEGVGAFVDGGLVSSARLYHGCDSAHVCGFSSSVGLGGLVEMVSFVEDLVGDCGVTFCSVNDYYGLSPAGCGFDLVCEYDPATYSVNAAKTKRVAYLTDSGLTCSDSGSRLWTRRTEG